MRSPNLQSVNYQYLLHYLVTTVCKFSFGMDAHVFCQIFSIQGRNLKIAQKLMKLVARNPNFIYIFPRIHNTYTKSFDKFSPLHSFTHEQLQTTMTSELYGTIQKICANLSSENVRNPRTTTYWTTRVHWSGKLWQFHKFHVERQTHSEMLLGSLLVAASL